MLATVAAADSAKVQRKSTASLYIAKWNHTLCTLYINRRVHCVFYSICANRIGGMYIKEGHSIKPLFNQPHKYHFVLSM